MFLSVIIPVYNVELYISRCIDSVIEQELNNEIELLLVDDGSKDSSGKICDEYARNYSWIKVFHISNGGVGNARNFGLMHASGEYITFIDSDDFLDKGIYTEIFNLHKEYNADVYVFGYKDYPQNEMSKSHILKQDYCNSLSTLSEKYLEMKQDYLMFSVFNKVFRRSICNDIYFNTEVHYFEDYLFALTCLNKVKSLCTIDKAAYNYVHHEGEHLGGKYTKPEIIVNVAEIIKSLSFSLPQNKELRNYTVLEYYNNLLHAMDSSKGFLQRLKYTRILIAEIKNNGLLEDFRNFLGRRKHLMVIPNTIGIIMMSYLRSLILKLR